MEDLERIIQGDYPSFFLVGGPCAVESYEVCYQVAKQVKSICRDLDILFIFKSSFRKANRSKLESFQGIGDAEAIEILQRIRTELQVPVTTDIHESSDVDLLQGKVDVLQIPAFLCRQTALLQKAGASGLPVNIKKGQFMSGASMNHAKAKVKSGGDVPVFLTERGNSFGYGDLVVDPRNIAIMSQEAITIMDCTHATQRPNQTSGVTGGDPEEIELFAKVGLVSGAKGLFIEVHPDPARALSDGASMLALDRLENLLITLKNLSEGL